jgi:hypothetical protein
VEKVLCARQQSVVRARTRGNGEKALESAQSWESRGALNATLRR